MVRHLVSIKDKMGHSSRPFDITQLNLHFPNDVTVAVSHLIFGVNEYNAPPGVISDYYRTDQLLIPNINIKSLYTKLPYC